ncbi:MAG: zinc-ribbon domain containing protein [Candidatus Peribacteraceae bacterium]|jgi:CxxC-x17-CxxC domain-containing protein
MADQQLQCRDCGQTFTFTEGEQEFYNSRNLSAPQRCKDCRQKRKNERLTTREMHAAVCAKCGAQCEVPFKPRPVEEGGKPVLCKDCFFAQRQAAGA